MDETSSVVEMGCFEEEEALVAADETAGDEEVWFVVGESRLERISLTTRAELKRTQVLVPVDRVVISPCLACSMSCGGLVS